MKANRCSHTLHSIVPLNSMCIDAQCSAPSAPEHEHRWDSDEDWAWRMAEMRADRPSRARLWWWRARHAWSVGLDGPWLERVLIRCMYTLGILDSPTWMGQRPVRRTR